MKKQLVARELVKIARELVGASEYHVTLHGRDYVLPKKLSNRDIKFLETLDIGTREETVRNPLIGGSERLHPVAVALYDFIMGCQMIGGPRGAMISKFDLAMDIFIKCWPKAYMTLLD